MGDACMRTLREELNRRSLVEAQMKDLLDAAAQPAGADLAGMANLGRALLYLEMYEKNERSKARYHAPMSDLIATLKARIQQRAGE